MKVVLLAPTPPPAGGIAGWTVRMMNATLKNGWEVKVVDEKVVGGREVFGSKQRKSFFIEAKRCINIWKQLKEALKDEETAVVHSCIPSRTLSMIREYVCALITKSKKRKFIMHFRCTVPTTTKGKIGNFVLKILCNKCDLIMVLNNQTIQYLNKITKTPMKLIPNFISASELLDSHKINDEIKTVIYVGGVIKTKGAYDALEIAKEFPEIQFRFIGKTDGEIESYAQANSLKNAVFTGPLDREEVKEELKNADVFLFMSFFRGEGFSNALAEAMAMGLPCIVTDWAANADMIGDDGGAVVKVGDVQSAVKALNKMQPADVRKRMSEANIEKVKNEYVDYVVLDQYVDTYEQLINEG